MMKRIAGFLVSFLLAASLWAGATFARITTWTDGQTLTASALNAEFENILHNGTPTGWDDYSASLSQMQSTADPYPGSVESQATSLAGELERLRFQILEIKKAIQPSNVTYWYQDAPTAGVFSIVGSSVGVNDTTPDYTLDVAGSLGIDGTVTTSSHVVIAGDLTVGGSVTYTTGFTVISAFVGVSSQTISPTATAVKINFSSKTIDTLSEWSTTNSSFTALNTGRYRVSLCLTTQQDATAASWGFMIFKNEVLYSGTVFSDTVASASTHPNFFSDVLSLTAGDVITIKAAEGSGAGGFWHILGQYNGFPFSGSPTKPASGLTIERIL